MKEKNFYDVVTALGFQVDDSACGILESLDLGDDSTRKEAESLLDRAKRLPLSTGTEQSDGAKRPPLGAGAEQSVRASLESLGVHISDDVYASAREQVFGADESAYAQAVLQIAGMGELNEETLEFISDNADIYAFDAEFASVSTMYTQFFRGVNRIVPDIEFADVIEDLSGIVQDESSEDAASDGVRSVSFTANGRPYTITLRSHLDWINPEVLDRLNEVLESEGAAGRLYAFSEEMDQMVLLCYGTPERASALAKLIGNDAFKP